MHSVKQSTFTGSARWYVANAKAIAVAFVGDALTMTAIKAHDLFINLIGATRYSYSYNKSVSEGWLRSANTPAQWKARS